MALLVTTALGASPAQASRALLSEEVLKTKPGPPPTPPPEAEIEGACGLAFGGGSLYVSDYYHGVVDVFSSGGLYLSQIAGAKAPEGPCGLALDPGGRLYANVWHQRVVLLRPSTFTVDSKHSTGVAVDPATGDVWVDDRTHIAEYEAQVDPDDEPAGEIDLGASADAYGVAAFGGRVYVPDAAEDTVKIYEPAVSLTAPVKAIAGFTSLVDAAVAVDPSNGHLLVADNVQPGFTHPEAAIFEFDSTGKALGRLPGGPVDGEPSGLAVAADGTLYVTDGNDELANVFEYSPYSAAPSELAPPGESAGSSSGQAAALQGGSAAASGAAGTAAAASLPAGPLAPRPLRQGGGGSALAQNGSVRVAVSGGLAPTRLPRSGSAPISVTIGGRISALDPSNPPQLRGVSFAFNRAGRLDTRGLPRCGLSDIDPSTTRQALEACRDALVGEGQFSANVRLPEQSPFPSAGKVLAFNGSLHGKPVIFAHVYGPKPVPTSVVMPLAIHRAKGTFGTRLDASLTALTGDWGYVTGIDLRLGRKYRSHGERRSFLSAGCPAPRGFPGAVFPLARASFSFVGGKTLTATLTRNCTVR